jgi:hypothetical protein
MSTTNPEFDDLNLQFEALEYQPWELDQSGIFLNNSDTITSGFGAGSVEFEV